MTWLIVAAYLAIGAMVSRRVARNIATAVGEIWDDPGERVVVAFFALLGGLFWPITLAFAAFTAWLLPKEKVDD